MGPGRFWRLPSGMSSLPFARLNLRWNPFGEPAFEEHPALFAGGLEDWPSFLSNGPTGEGGGASRALQLLGPSGCGKTTSLRSLKELLPDATLVAWCPVGGWPELPATQAGLLLVDDAHMARGAFFRKIHLYRAVAMATQKDLAGSFRASGFELKTVLMPDRVTLTRLVEMVQRRLEWARRCPGPLPEVEKGALKKLLNHHGPDLKAIQADLYDRYQQLEDGA